MNPGGEEELRGAEGGKIVIRIDYVRKKSIFKKRENIFFLNLACEGLNVTDQSQLFWTIFSPLYY